MSDTPPCASPLVNDRLDQINAATNGTLSFGMFATVGRSLVAGRDIGCGEVVLQDTPIVTFHQPLGTSNVVPTRPTSSLENVQLTQGTNIIEEDWSTKLERCCLAAHKVIAGESSSALPQPSVPPTVAPKAVVPEYLQAAARALWPLVQSALQPEASTIPSSYSNSLGARGVALLDMHIPELPINAEVTRLYRFCESVVRSTSASSGGNDGDENEEAVTALVHAVMAAKVNSHRSADGTHWCLYPIASKLAHSCDPNMFYVPTMSSVSADSVDDDANRSPYGAKFIATRDIVAGELLSFSYLGGDLLVGPAEPRQARLAASHRFVCACSRCSSMDTFTSEIFSSNSTLGRVLLPTNSYAYIIRRTGKRLQTDQDTTMKNMNSSWQKQGVWCVVDTHRMEIVGEDTISITDAQISKALNTTPIKLSSLSSTSSSSSDSGGGMKIGDLVRQSEIVVGLARDVVATFTSGGKKIPASTGLADCSKILELISALGGFKTLLTDSIGSRHYLVSHIVDCQCKLSKLGGNILQSTTVSITAAISDTSISTLHNAIKVLLDIDPSTTTNINSLPTNDVAHDGDDSDSEEDGSGGVTAALTTCKELLVRLHGRYTMHYIVWTSLTADIGSCVTQGKDRVVGVTHHQMCPTFIQHVSSSPSTISQKSRRCRKSVDGDIRTTNPSMSRSKCTSLPHMVVIQSLRSWCENVITTAKPKLAALVMKQMMLKNAQKKESPTVTPTSHTGPPSTTTTLLQEKYPSCLVHFRQTSNDSNPSVLGSHPFIAEDATEVPPFEEEYNINLLWVDSGVVLSQELMGFTFPTQGQAAEVPTLFPNHKDLYNLVMACMVGNLIVAPSLGALSGGVGEDVGGSVSGLSSQPSSCGGGGLEVFSKNLALLTKCLLGGGSGRCNGQDQPHQQCHHPSQDTLRLLVPDYTVNFEYKSLSDVLFNTNRTMSPNGSPLVTTTTTVSGSTTTPKAVVVQIRRSAFV